MSKIDLSGTGTWILETTPDREGELELTFEEGYGASGVTYLTVPQMLRLRDVIDNAISQCRCSYVVLRRVCDEFPEYTLGAADKVCPFHG